MANDKAKNNAYNRAQGQKYQAQAREYEAKHAANEEKLRRLREAKKKLETAITDYDTFKKNTEKIDGYVVMMQREVANRLNAKVGTKDYNSLTILLNYYTDVEYLFTVTKKVFVPAPNVESAVVKIMTKEKKEFEVDLNIQKKKSIFP